MKGNLNEIIYNKEKTDKNIGCSCNLFKLLLEKKGIRNGRLVTIIKR